MNFDGNFSRLGELGDTDLDAIETLVASLDEAEWNADAFRQRRYEVHRDTQTIGLVFDPDFRHTHPTRLPMLERFQGAIRPALETVAEHFESTSTGKALTGRYGLGYFVRATLVRLKAGGEIPEHTDNNFSLTHSHRVHVPVTTNPDVAFTVGGETRVLAAGEIVEINNRRPHRVENAGAADRVHLILDFVLPGEMCCCGRRRHPDTLCSPQACEPTDHLQIRCECYPQAANDTESA